MEIIDNELKLGDAWKLIDELADESTKEMFELDDILYDISMKIYEFRLKNDLTQKQLAEKLGIKQSMVSKLESGQYNPSIEQLWKISKKLGWNFKIIFGEENGKAKIWDTVDLEENLNDETDKKLETKLAVGS
ncbi:helix-turn-helix domain-containing protein [Thermoanaerobacterium thermosaccharolyticum]|uniref:Transcriptional regulator n=1 Tax=Thermoanaerobacterium thermosaccharolyticum TaxID=1517 RepID=A0A231VN77_THETR|nr:helix-turn-helix transcriptional regulator [Thermoanaerobacterium thermosaccharolyticum]MCP2239499.1 transcriptional regulator with XRE-family HTH domain [Thermoanaerobacterium thermosaccharolyticum]OXT09534.1 transcriptional regulator [Thermoanaerobacterium thermosaccharolyticum]